MKQPVIEFNNFSYHYRVQSEPTLKNINLTIYAGEKVLIVGPSGSGKSTLAHTLNGLIPFSSDGTASGSLKIMGQETNTLSIFELSRMVGTVLQDPDGQFIGLTVAEDIAFSLENRCVSQSEMKQSVHQISKLVDISAHLDAAPHSLSGGQKQRTSLGGVLVEDVDILLFDEPLASLDPASGKLAIELIDEINKESKKTIVIVEHRLEDVLYAPIDRIIVMDKGQILADMSPADLLKTNLLTQIGVREPLYISALRFAGCNVDSTCSLDRLHEFNALPYQQDLKNFINDQNQLDQVKVNYSDKTSSKLVDQVHPLLEFKDVCFGYEKNKSLLQHINFKINQGDMVSIVGKNGAGKSTLSKLICGFYHPNQGKLLFNGQDMSMLSIKERARKIGIVMQNPNQMISKPMLYDEVALALRLQGLNEDDIKPRVYETLKICGLYPMRNWPISALSYGQKKRVTIASILVANPELLILDEPTAGQDFKHYTELMDFLKSLNKRGITILMITHDMHLMLEYTSRTLVLSDAKIQADSTLVEVLSDPKLIKNSHLRETSLYTLSVKAELNSPEALTRSFINFDKRRRTLCHQIY